MFYYSQELKKIIELEIEKEFNDFYKLNFDR